MGKAPLLGFAFALVTFAPAQAAPATSDEAAQLTTLFERYVGTPAAGEPSAVTVSPDGESYRVTLDLKRALKGLDSFGVTVDPNTSTTMLTPLPDGTWKVTSTDSPPIVVHVKDQSISIKSATTTFDGIYDPRMPAFKTAEAHYTNYVYDQTTPTVVQHRQTDKITFTAAGTPADGGTVSGTAQSVSEGTRAEFQMRSPTLPPASATTPGVPQPPATPPLQFAYLMPSATTNVIVEKLHTKELLDLWAFLVAHPDRDSLLGAQDGLRTVLRAALPVLSGFRENATVDGVAVTTPIGAFSAKAMGGAVDLANLDGAGRVTTEFTIKDLVVPADQLPPWTAGLVPTAISLNIGADGFHAADAAAEAVNDFDLKSDKPFTPEQTTKIGHLAVPGVAILKLLPSELTAKLLDIKLDGQATLGTVPDGRLNVKAAGLDKAIAQLQAASGTDPSAQALLGPLVLAKNLAKPEPDGSLSWLVEVKGDGPVTVNGAPLQ